MLIPFQELQPETLHNLMADFVSREGTDNGDMSTEVQKIDRVQKALKSGDAVIFYNAEMTQCILMRKDDVSKDMLQAWAP
ncbi:YheU family protein [Pseudomonas sp. NPDC089569]|uniref:YheU family protein n=1 Tax=Pseudomonas sp. NPDC089569 TaxID=3390722 RepID=UPI003D0170C6